MSNNEREGPFGYPYLDLSRIIPDPEKPPSKDKVFLPEEHLFLLDILVNYGKLKSSERRAKARRIASFMVSTAGAFEGVLGSFNIIEKYSLSGKENLSLLRADVLRLLDEEAAKLNEVPEPEVIGQYLFLAAHNPNFQELARNVIRGYFQLTHNMAEKKPEKTEKQRGIVDLAYNMCLYALKKADPEVEELVMRILSFAEEKIFDPEKRIATSFILASFSENDDILGKFLDVDYTLQLFREIYDPSVNNIFSEAVKKIVVKKDYLNYLESLPEERRRAIEDFYEASTTRREGESVLEEVPFPASLLLEDRELRRLYLKRYGEYMAAKSNEVSFTLYLPGSQVRLVMIRGEPGEVVTPEILRREIQKILIEAYREKGEGGKVLSKEAIKMALEVFRPEEITPEALARLRDLNQKIKKELWENAAYTVSPRGDKIIVEDPLLNSYGLTDILFELVVDSSGKKVTFTIGKYHFSFLIDGYHTVTFEDGTPLMISEEARVWWESLILSYLKELTCQPETGPEKGRVTVMIKKGEKLIELEGEKALEEEYTQRRAHRRKLPKGKGYTEEQRNKVLNYTGGNLDLEEYNRSRNLTKEDGQYTFVLPQEKVRKGQRKPIIIKLPKATEVIKQLLVVN